MNALLHDARLFLSLVLLSMLIFLFDKINLLKLPKSGLQYVSLPIQYGLYQSGKNITSQLDLLISARLAAQEKKVLQKQMGELLSENAVLKRRLVESEVRIEQQNFLSPKIFNMVSARPIGLDRYLLIDQGSDNGIQPNQVVVFKDNYIGQIKEVTPRLSKVLLQHDPDSKIAAFSQGPNGRARGILQGQFGSQLLMDKILHQEPVDEGNLVYSEGTEGRLPRGLILGTVIQVHKRANEVFKQAVVKPVFNLSDLELIFVITNL